MHYSSCCGWLLLITSLPCIGTGVCTCGWQGQMTRLKVENKLSASSLLSLPMFIFFGMFHVCFPTSVCTLNTAEVLELHNYNWDYDSVCVCFWLTIFVFLHLDEVGTECLDGSFPAMVLMLGEMQQHFLFPCLPIFIKGGWINCDCWTPPFVFSYGIVSAYKDTLVGDRLCRNKKWAKSSYVRIVRSWASEAEVRPKFALTTERES